MYRKFYWYARTTASTLLKTSVNRDKTYVSQEYSDSWSSYKEHLINSNNLSNWLCVPNVDDSASYHHLNGELKYGIYDMNSFNRQIVLEAIKNHFPHAKSITEYGCGLGRNLLYIKNCLPQIDCYGYELCKPGVELATIAAEKFNLDVNYSQLDYVNGEASDFVFPNTDVAFTMYSLEQLPRSNKEALQNIFNRSNLGSVHLEPVVENYPNNWRGILGKMNHKKIDYLKNFESNAGELGINIVEKRVFNTAHNPLMFPSLYVLKK
jgi:hypothetical protein